MGLARTFQITNLFSGLTVHENVLVALLRNRGSAFSMHSALKTDIALARSGIELIERWGLSSIAHRLARDISYGEKRQVDLMLAMAITPRILLLDEPTAGLSASEVVRVVAMIRDLPDDITVLMIEHDMEVAFDIADRISVLNQGRLIVEGDVETIRNDQLVTDIYLGTD
jgi:branched-chain amino acid transport system ATP-binding protein